MSSPTQDSASLLSGNRCACPSDYQKEENGIKDSPSAPLRHQRLKNKVTQSHHAEKNAAFCEK